MSEAEQMRLFVGVKVSLATVHAVKEATDAMRDAANDAGVLVRWVAPASYHVTLKFLGWTRRPAVTAVVDRLTEVLAGERPFEFAARGAGAFPSVDRARVLWIGVDDDGTLARLAGAIDTATAELGYPAERRPFHPHITIGRLKRFGSVERVVLPWAEQEFRVTSADSIVLFESKMKSKGSEYTPVHTWALESSKRQTERLQLSPENREPSEADDASIEPAES